MLENNVHEQELSQEEQRLLREWYEKHRSQYLDRATSQQETFDNTLILLSSGAVAGLVTVGMKIGSSCLLIFAIFSFLLTIASSMLSLVSSVKLHEDFYKQFDENFEKKDYSKVLSSSWETWVKYTNNISIITAILGLFFIIILVFINPLKIIVV